MNIYDFDKTIYDGDSTAGFVKYCSKHYKKAYITIIPTLWAFFLYMIGIYTKTQFKEKMYRFLKYIPDIDSAVKDYWDTHEQNILDYYKKQHREDDIIISASPEFLLRPICDRLGIKHLIASRVDKHTGKYTGENCWGAEKVIRLKDEYGIGRCDSFYSDSFSDTPLADIADKAYIVRRNDLTPWHEYKESTGEKLKHMFLNPEFLVFIIVGGINTVACVALATIFRSFINGDPIVADNISFALGYLGANIIGYILNSLITFKDKKLSILKYFKFFISYIPNFCIQQGIVWLCSTFTTLPMLVKSAAAAIIGIPVTFVIMKIFTFKKKD
ncbi:MAG: HAD-IB family phosphatase [Oscillospiraceae bacterium]|nr:HAD-IB family phosphatase [Oscillospiraceae bacterium]